jgi:hypothetical protein
MRDEIEQLRDELRQAVDALRPFSHSDGEYAFVEFKRAREIVAAYDAKHPEGKQNA